jgi:hypothetical protein
MRYAVILLLSLLLAGCGSTGVKNKLEAQLMPETIAKKKVLARYFGEEWVNNPVGRYTQGFGSLCGDNGWGPMPINEITTVRQFPGRLMLDNVNWLLVGIPCQIQAYTIQRALSEQDVDDIVDALVSLGAKIDVKGRQLSPAPGPGTQ